MPTRPSTTPLGRVVMLVAAAALLHPVAVGSSPGEIGIALQEGP